MEREEIVLECKHVQCGHSHCIRVCGFGFESWSEHLSHKYPSCSASLGLVGKRAPNVKSSSMV